MRASRALRAIGPGVAVGLLVGVAALRFVFPDAAGIMLLAVVPITALGMMYGLRGGLAAAVFATAVFIAWSAGAGDPSTLEHIHHPLVFLLLGFVSGYWAHGALGVYDRGHAAALRRLNDAISNGEIVLHYQPIVASREGPIVALEGLARWDDPQRGPIPPLEFVRLAESDRETLWAFTVHTLRTAARDLQGWGELEGVTVSVNLAPGVLRRRDLGARIAEITGAQGVGLEQLGVEVTESALVGGDPEMVRALTDMREGVAGIAIDDFGTGYSSLARLDRLPVSTIKLDLELVQRLHRPAARSIGTAIVGMAHALGLSAVAEGVEDDGTLELLEEMHCDAVQGFLVGRAVPPEDVPRLLRALGGIPG